MAKPIRNPTKYNSLTERIIDYQKRRAAWLNEKWEKNIQRDAEYFALTKLRGTIKKDIISQMEVLSNYQKLTEQGFLSTKDVSYSKAKRDKEGEIIKDEKGNQVNGPLIEFLNGDKYHILINKNEHVREELEKECQEFIEEVLSVEKIRCILDLIFSTSYKSQKDHEEYRITVATMMLQQAVWEIGRFLPSGMQFLKEDLHRADEIAKSIYYSKSDKFLP